LADNNPQFIYVTTTGWKTGNQHEIEIWYVEHGGRYYLVSEREYRSHWVQNIQQNPTVMIRLGKESFPGQGRVIDRAGEPELAAEVSALMDKKYNWSDGLIVELRRDGE
jgi:deazaflavin-dependent oxidoreductase (nitroreductase family)